MTDTILEPELPIVDPHHHLWGDRPQITLSSGKLSLRPTRYLFDDLLADVNSGHNIRASVYIDAMSMYKADGPEEFRSVGETEFVNGVAAMSASGQFGEARLCAGIISKIDFRMGDLAGEVLDAHLAASDRFRGIRQGSAFHPDPLVMGTLPAAPEGLLGSAEFRAGFKHLAPRDLSFDAFFLATQFDEVIDLARNFPDTKIIVNHLGTPLGIGGYSLTGDFEQWRSKMTELAESPNVYMKVGGLGMAFFGFPSFRSEPPASEEQLAEEWRPHVEAAIEIFGVDRCMLESNFPVELDTVSYARLWNVFKRLTTAYSPSERTALFSKTATDAYRLEY